MGKNKYNSESFSKELLDRYNGEYELIGEYINSTTEIEFKHNCGMTFIAKPAALLCGQDKCECLKRRKEDLTGQTFGRLTVMYPFDFKDDSGRYKYMCHCRCECGNEVDMQKGNLKSGHTSSCGCYNKEQIKKTQTVDLTGKRFGKLLVLNQAENRVFRSGSSTTWRCLCDCGNTTTVLQSLLVSGNTRSCGCLAKVATEPASLKKEDSLLKFFVHSASTTGGL